MKRGFDAPAGGSAQVAGFERLKVKQGEEVVFRLLQEPLLLKQHRGDPAAGTFSAICSMEEIGSCPICEDEAAPPKRRQASFMAAVPVFVHAIKGSGQPKFENIGEVRVFEYGVKVQSDLQNLVGEWDWKTTDFRLRREGSGLQDTRYYLSPTSKPHAVPKDTQAPDLEAFYREQMTQAAGAQPAEASGAAAKTAGSYPDPFDDQ